VAVRSEPTEHLFLANCKKGNVQQAQMRMKQRDFLLENLCGNTCDAMSSLVSSPDNVSRLFPLMQESA